MSLLNARVLGIFLLFNITCLSPEISDTKQEDQEIFVTPESAQRLNSTFDKIADIVSNIENSISDKAGKIKEICILTREIIKEAYKKIQGTSAISLNTAQFIFAVKAFLTVTLFMFLSSGLFGVGNIFVATKFVAKLLAPYLGYLIGNIAKNSLIGLKNTLKECVNFASCSPALKEKLIKLQAYVTRSFDVNFVIEKGPALLVAAMAAAACGAFGLARGLFKVVFPAYV